MFKRFSILTYAVVAYIIAMANLVYIMGFIIDFGVPKGINDGIQSPIWLAALIDVGLLWVFGLHHSVTARASFKKVWTRFIPPAIERATYLLMTAGMTGLLIYFWQPIPVTIWQVENSFISQGIIALYCAVWVIMLGATFQFGYLNFFGIQQAWERFRNIPARHVSFSKKWLFGIVRHPISVCWMLTPWLTPHLTVGSVVFALGITSYIIVSTPFEEADLKSDIGDAYDRYKKEVPAFVPFLRKKG